MNAIDQSIESRAFPIHSGVPGEPLVVDSFAGGGGASTGIEAALRRLKEMGLLPGVCRDHVTFAINHDGAALAMHEANHPNTIHIEHDVWKTDMHELVGNNPIGLLWMSPDCRHFSAAKGGAPVSKSVRDLAWVCMKWLKELKPHQKPALICLENVREFQFWGPLIRKGKDKYVPCKKRKGKEFQRWVRALKAMGYHVEWRELRACDYGTPTIRNRLYLIARNDGLPIQWPAPTHGEPGSPEVEAGLLEPWNLTAGLVDWDRPCPSIFMTKEESAAYRKETGIRINRPLVDNTNLRLAKGIKRFVVESAKPFLVVCNHSDDSFRGQGLDRPFATVTRSRDAHGLVAPHLVSYYGEGNGGTDRSSSMLEPLLTVTTEPRHAMVAPQLVPLTGDAVAGVMTEMYGRSDARSMQDGLSTVTQKSKHALTTAVLAGERIREGTDVAFWVKRDFGESVGSAMTDPIGVVTPGGQGKAGVVGAFLAQHNTDVIGHHAETPLSTIVGKGSTQGVVAAHMLSLKGRERRSGEATSPHPTICSGGQQSGVVQAPLVDGRLHGLTPDQLTGARRVAEFLREHGCWDGGEIVTVGPYVIVDIGMRMLTARELARAQGLPEDYELAAMHNGKPLSDTEQRHKIGNSVCPQVAEAIVVENYRPRFGMMAALDPEPVRMAA